MIANLLLSLGLCTLLSVAGFLILNRKLDRALALDKTLSRVREEVGGLIRDLNQTTERNVVILEERIARVKDVLGRADRQLEVLQREAERRETSLKTYNHLRNAAVRSEQELPFKAPEPPPAPLPPPESRETAPSVRSDRETLRKRVLELHNQGITAELIAEKTEIPRGEVELIISVFRR